MYVSSYYYCMCVLILLYMCPHTTVCVLILLYMCPHTTIYEEEGEETFSYCYMCPHTAIYVSLYYYIWGGGEETFNFTLKLQREEQRVRLWVDNVLLIDSWRRLPSLLLLSLFALLVQKDKQ
jgi:hypothetical protein